MQHLYAGLDVSDSTTSICLVNAKAEVVLAVEAETCPIRISEHLKPYKRALKLVGLESGNTGIWLNKELLKAGYPVVCLDARHAHSALSARTNKTDVNDARGLAELLARGIFTVAYTKSDEALRIRTVLALRTALIEKARDLDLHVRGSQKCWGLAAAPKKRGRKVIKAPGREEVALQCANDATVRAIDFLSGEARTLLNHINQMARESDTCRRLMTIPGVGPITALAFVAAVDDPTRFETSRDVAAYFGLTPRTYSSGTSTRSGRISRRGDPSMRRYLYLAAQALVIRSHSECRLRKWAIDLAKRKGNRAAFVACSRKLAVLMHRLWVAGEDFDEAR